MWKYITKGHKHQAKTIYEILFKDMNKENGCNPLFLWKNIWFHGTNLAFVVGLVEMNAQDYTCTLQ
jgi:hypothetical protein